jgi:predicted membrane chloride channel (bestrophin family)
MQTTSYSTPEGSVLSLSTGEADKVARLSDRIIFRWITAEVISHSVTAVLLTGGVYLLDEYFANENPTVTIVPHTITGFVLGLLLVCRVVMGSNHAYEAGSLLTKFCRSLRTISLYSTYVTETDTISSGAELEKRGVADFRYDLVRLLNLAWAYYKAMLNESKVEKPPPSLLPKDISSAEVHVLSSVKNPTIFIAKLISQLLEHQFSSHRLRAEQVSLFSGELASLIDTYHSSQALGLKPPSPALEGFTKLFTMIWVYTLCPVIAITELQANPAGENTAGFIIALCYTFFIALFYFGLFDAGKLVAKPFQAALAVVDLTAMTNTLSDDLANLVDDGEVPVFLAASD